MEDDDSLGVPSTLDEENIEDTPVYGMSLICSKGHL